MPFSLRGSSRCRYRSLIGPDDGDRVGERNPARLSSRRCSGPQERKASITAQGHPRAIFRRAIERQNLLVAETTLRELGRPTTEELLLLTALICLKQPERGRRVAARLLERYLAETPQITIDDASLVASLLAALGGPRHAQALAALLDMTRRASSTTRAADVRSA